MSVPRDLGVGMVGYAFMGRAHSNAWRAVAHQEGVALTPRMVAVCGRDAAAAEKAAHLLGWTSSETDWRALITRDDVGLIDICTPGATHAPIAIEGLRAGKHVLCEKPLANTVEEAEEMVRAAEAAPASIAMVGFNYRRIPALALARRLVQGGTLGRLRQVRAVYLQDWLVDPDFPMTWRLRREQAGSGALGDLGAHIVDLVQYLSGERVVEVAGRAATFVEERAGEGGRPEPVTVDDAVLFSGSLAGGAMASFEATRFATGSKNALRVELDGQEGALRFDLERLNELEVYERSQPYAGFRRVLVTEPDDPYLSAWWPPGHVLGWEHTFIHQARDLLHGIAAATPVAPTFADGLGVQRVLAAVEESARDGGRRTPVAS